MDNFDHNENSQGERFNLRYYTCGISKFRTLNRNYQCFTEKCRLQSRKKPIFHVWFDFKLQKVNDCSRLYGLRKKKVRMKKDDVKTFGEFCQKA